MDFFKNLTPPAIIITILIGWFVAIILALPFTEWYSLVYLFFTPIVLLFSVILAFLFTVLYPKLPEVILNTPDVTPKPVLSRNYFLSILLYLPFIIYFSNGYLFYVNLERFYYFSWAQIDLYALPLTFFILYLFICLFYFIFCKFKNKIFLSGVNIFNIKILDLFIFACVIVWAGLGGFEAGGKLVRFNKGVTLNSLFSKIITTTEEMVATSTYKEKSVSNPIISTISDDSLPYSTTSYKTYTSKLLGIGFTYPERFGDVIEKEFIEKGHLAYSFSGIENSHFLTAKMKGTISSGRGPYWGDRTEGGYGKVLPAQ